MIGLHFVYSKESVDTYHRLNGYFEGILILAMVSCNPCSLVFSLIKVVLRAFAE